MITQGIGSAARLQAIRDTLTRGPRRFDPPRDEQGKVLRISEFFGVNTFDLPKMREKLPKETFLKLTSTIESGKPLDREVANSVAHAIKEWALSRGVTHFCHWFQPQTGLTAEKHDAFIAFDDHHGVIEKFSGSQLIQSEPDASSFPSGGMRTTFEARGYTAWDPSSPVFIMDHANGRTLCIPSVFISDHADSLDEKTGLLRSIEVLSLKATDLLKTLGFPEIKKVTPTLGIEQEYFLIDRDFYSLRPDLIMAGRTLLGGSPPKGQQLEDHYFGSIPARVQAFMSEVEYELFKLGVPLKTRHNEVAPNQFECAPIFEEANIATDHNQLTMEVLRKVATRHHLAVLLHEKPFAGINGSGKHNNWSLMATTGDSNSSGENLLEPGQTPHQNLRFLLILTGILKGVHQHAGLLRGSIASSGNDHRLGANEAPPAIISVFLGDFLNQILNEIEAGRELETNTEAALIRLGVSKLPTVMKDNTDRNRTSPFAFTGNKFEFRAVGASASSAFPVTVLNTAVADGFEEMTQAIQKKAKSAQTVQTAVLEVIRETLAQCKAIRFEGNNYSEEWVTEAAQRGLPNFRKTPEALQQLVSQESRSLFSRLEIFSEAELQSRFHVRLERYIKNLWIEVDTLKSMIDTQILPSALTFHCKLSQGASASQSLGLKAPQLTLLNRLSQLCEDLQSKRNRLDEALLQIEKAEKDEQKAQQLSQKVSPIMSELRAICDELETVVDDQGWPLPKYREMLFLL